MAPFCGFVVYSDHGFGVLYRNLRGITNGMSGKTVAYINFQICYPYLNQAGQITPTHWLCLRSLNLMPLQHIINYGFLTTEILYNTLEV